MKTCKSCVNFRNCLRSGDAVIASSGNDLICEKYIQKAVFQRGNLERERFFVKAQDRQGNMVKGNLDYNFITEQYSIRDEKTKRNRIIEDSTICRNSGIKDNNGNYIYEFDLFEIYDGIKYDGLGFMWWNELHQKWVIRRFLTHTGFSDIKRYLIYVKGNIALCEDDEYKIIKQDIEQKK